MPWAWLPVGLVLALLGLGLWWVVDRNPLEESTSEHPPGRPNPTRAGIWVASEGEQRVANWLDSRGLAFDYEPELDCGLTPDFRLEDTDVLIEYWGLAGQPEYEERMVEKMEIYDERGYDVIGLLPAHVAEIDGALERELARRGIGRA